MSQVAFERWVYGVFTAWAKMSGRSGLGGADYMGVHAEGDRGVGMAQAGGDDMYWHSGEQQRRGVDVPQILS